jgi:hypothetical protein
MTIGFGTYNPQSDFAFPRSYVRGIAMYFGPNALVVWADNVCTFQDLTNPNVTGQFVLLPQFVAWSSNSYTLSFLPLEFWYRTSPGGPEIPADFVMNWGSTALDNDNYLVVNIFGLGTVRHTHDLPPPPPGYWRPPLYP